jgi:hypothetical protein
MSDGEDGFNTAKNAHKVKMPSGHVCLLRAKNVNDDMHAPLETKITIQKGDDECLSREGYITCFWRITDHIHVLSIIEATSPALPC